METIHSDTSVKRVSHQTFFSPRARFVWNMQREIKHFVFGFRRSSCHLMGSPIEGNDLHGAWLSRGRRRSQLLLRRCAPFFVLFFPSFPRSAFSFWLLRRARPLASGTASWCIVVLLSAFCLLLYLYHCCYYWGHHYSVITTLVFPCKVSYSHS